MVYNYKMENSRGSINLNTKGGVFRAFKQNKQYHDPVLRHPVQIRALLKWAKRSHVHPQLQEFSEPIMAHAHALVDAWRIRNFLLMWKREKTSRVHLKRKVFDFLRMYSLERRKKHKLLVSCSRYYEWSQKSRVIYKLYHGRGKKSCQHEWGIKEFTTKTRKRRAFFRIVEHARYKRLLSAARLHASLQLKRHTLGMFSFHALQEKRQRRLRFLIGHMRKRRCFHAWYQCVLRRRDIALRGNIAFWWHTHRIFRKWSRTTKEIIRQRELHEREALSRHLFQGWSRFCEKRRIIRQNAVQMLSRRSLASLFRSWKQRTTLQIQETNMLVSKVHTVVFKKRFFSKWREEYLLMKMGSILERERLERKCIRALRKHCSRKRYLERQVIIFRQVCVNHSASTSLRYLNKWTKYRKRLKVFSREIRMCREKYLVRFYFHTWYEKVCLKRQLRDLVRLKYLNQKRSVFQNWRKTTKLASVFRKQVLKGYFIKFCALIQHARLVALRVVFSRFKKGSEHLKWIHGREKNSKTNALHLLKMYTRSSKWFAKQLLLIQEHRSRKQSALVRNVFFALKTYSQGRRAKKMLYGRAMGLYCHRRLKYGLDSLMDQLLIQYRVDRYTRIKERTALGKAFWRLKLELGIRNMNKQADSIRRCTQLKSAFFSLYNRMTFEKCIRYNSCQLVASRKQGAIHALVLNVRRSSMLKQADFHWRKRSARSALNWLRTSRDYNTSLHQLAKKHFEGTAKGTVFRIFRERVNRRKLNRNLDRVYIQSAFRRFKRTTQMYERRLKRLRSAAVVEFSVQRRINQKQWAICKLLRNATCSIHLRRIEKQILHRWQVALLRNCYSHWSTETRIEKALARFRTYQMQQYWNGWQSSARPQLRVEYEFTKKVRRRQCRSVFNRWFEALCSNKVKQREKMTRVFAVWRTESLFQRRIREKLVALLYYKLNVYQNVTAERRDEGRVCKLLQRHSALCRGINGLRANVQSCKHFEKAFATIASETKRRALKFIRSYCAKKRHYRRIKELIALRQTKLVFAIWKLSILGNRILAIELRRGFRNWIEWNNLFNAKTRELTLFAWKIFTLRARTCGECARVCGFTRNVRAKRLASSLHTWITVVKERGRINTQIVDRYLLYLKRVSFRRWVQKHKVQQLLFRQTCRCRELRNEAFHTWHAYIIELKRRRDEYITLKDQQLKADIFLSIKHRKQQHKLVQAWHTFVVACKVDRERLRLLRVCRRTFTSWAVYAIRKNAMQRMWKRDMLRRWKWKIDQEREHIRLFRLRVLLQSWGRWTRQHLHIKAASKMAKEYHDTVLSKRVFLRLQANWYSQR
mmetsp:Transcript_27203/g.43719  ORF Transcript_27203/g.43719 Transcript_27203/m.43719 type:complete len:1321 (-) Transcript_27203:3496-7458(-)